MRADERYRSIPGTIRTNAPLFADREAVVDGERRVTYSELAERALRATRAVIAKVQREFYPDPGPVVTALRVEGFAFEDLLIEIEAMAIVRG